MIRCTHIQARWRPVGSGAVWLVVGCLLPGRNGRANGGRRVARSRAIERFNIGTCGKRPSCSLPVPRNRRRGFSSAPNLTLYPPRAGFFQAMPMEGNSAVTRMSVGALSAMPPLPWFHGFTASKTRIPGSQARIPSTKSSTGVLSPRSNCTRGRSARKLNGFLFVKQRLVALRVRFKDSDSRIARFWAIFERSHAAGASWDQSNTAIAMSPRERPLSPRRTSMSPQRSSRRSTSTSWPAKSVDFV